MSRRADPRRHVTDADGSVWQVREDGCHLWAGDGWGVDGYLMTPLPLERVESRWGPVAPATSADLERAGVNEGSAP